MCGNPGADRPAKLRIGPKLLRRYLRTTLRGRTRFTAFLARSFGSFHTVPIQIADWPPVFVDLRLDGSAIWLRGSPWTSSPWEPSEQAIMRRVVRPGDAAFDIGANVGFHTVLLSRLVGPGGQVVAFEPNPMLLPCLRGTVAGLGNTELVEVALSDRNAGSTLFVPEDHTLASLSQWFTERGAGHGQVLACIERTIDDLIASQQIPVPDFVKCDVEGAELKVFHGGQVLFDRVEAPIILFEANAATAHGFGFVVYEARQFLEALPTPRYSFHWVEEAGVLGRVDSTDRPHSNILAVPQSRTDRVR